MCNIFIKNQHLQHLNKIKLCDYIDFLYPFIKVIWYLSVSSLRSHKPQVYGSFITIWGERAFTHPKEIASLRRQRSLWRAEWGRVSRSPTTFNISLREGKGVYLPPNSHKPSHDYQCILVQWLRNTKLKIDILLL